jgi:hypothetical protein
MKIHLVHGIHNAGLGVACYRLLPFLQGLGLPVAYPDYGFILGLESQRINPAVVGSILPYVEPGDIMVGHSNGCAIISELAARGAPMAGMVFINGALKDNITIPPQIQWAEVFFNNGDDITELAKIAATVYLVDQSWGEMGHHGYAGADPRVTGNWDCGKMPGMPSVDGHSEIFDPTNLAAWGPFIADRIKAHLPL